ncbi:MAG: hypothetical protein IH920_06165 [Chloroflexi bacterium]|nr:hypothetical protein [Chloroflexota bacterium]
MLSDSQLNVYIVGDNLSPRQRVQLQAQLDSALRALPQWCLDLVRAALDSGGRAAGAKLKRDELRLPDIHVNPS